MICLSDATVSAVISPLSLTPVTLPKKSARTGVTAMLIVSSWCPMP